MKYNLKTLEEADIKGKKILLRVAYDITLQEQDGKIIVPDDTRIRATIPTINYLLEQGSSIGLLSWLKRPAGKIDPKLSMKPVADTLSSLLGRPVKHLSDCVGPQVMSNLDLYKIVMLENVRFHPEEESADQNFAKLLVKGFDIIVYDAFAQAHRVHASTTGILQEQLPSVCGRLFIKEIEILSKLLENPDRPFIAVMGGAKISDRIGVMNNLLKRADKILIGGALTNMFFKAKGLEVGHSLVEDTFVDAARGEKQDYVEICRRLLEEAGDKIELPIDMVAATKPDSKPDRIKVINIRDGETIDKFQSYYDIGPKTIEYYGKILKEAKMIFANGPMGLFEVENFAKGTKGVAEAMIASGATTVLGGGDTESIVERYGWEGKFTHVSTGGGAALEFLAGKEFPVMKYLIKSRIQ